MHVRGPNFFKRKPTWTQKTAFGSIKFTKTEMKEKNLVKTMGFGSEKGEDQT